MPGRSMPRCWLHAGAPRLPGPGQSSRRAVALASYAALIATLTPLALIAQERATLSPGSSEARAALFEPLWQVDSASLDLWPEARDTARPMCLEAALVAGVAGVAQRLSHAAWIDSWLPTKRRSSFDFFAGSNGFAWSAGYTAIRCYTAGRGG